jgi:hypothetical protein
MAGTILTPTSIWNGFEIESDLSAEIISEKKSGDLILSKIRISGRPVKDGSVSIYATLAKNIQQAVAPAILFVQEFNSDADESLIKDLAKHGYTVLSVDLAGKTEGKENYTEYPQSLSYANYALIKDDVYHIEHSVTQSCWYEWGCVLRYALAYLKKDPSITKVGGVGVAEAATVLWEVAGTDASLDCAVFMLNAGWVGYRGINKFDGTVEPQFSDDMYKFIAGVEPQAYAMHVKCPTLMLSATNSSLYDCDRAYDTISRIDKDVYKAIHYSVGYRERVSGEAYRTTLIFLENFLMKAQSNCSLPFDIDLRCDVVDGKLNITVDLDDKDLSSISVYMSEQIATPALRCWHKISSSKKTDEGYVFEYLPYYLSGAVNLFAQAEYKNGTVIGSKIINKKFTENEIGPTYKSNVVYTSRELDNESVLAAAGQDQVNHAHINFADKKRVITKKGPMGIVGAYSEWGIMTFKINAEKDRPKEGAMLMVDVYCKNGGELLVKLVADYFGTKTEFIARSKIPAGNVWHNFQMETSKFKTAEGMGLKSYAKIQAMEFLVDGEDYLINNILWV